MSKVQEAVDHMEYRYKATEGGFLTETEVDRYELRKVLDRLALLEELVKEVPINVGDTVQEIGDEEPTGVVLGIRVEHGIVVFEVKLFREYANLKTINYYREEIELVERAK